MDLKLTKDIQYFEKISERIFKDFFKLKKHESVLIINDKDKRELSYHLLDAASKITNDTLLIEIPLLKHNAQEPPNPVSELMKRYDVILALTSKSISHTRARNNACKEGVRVATMPGINKEMFLRSVDINYEKVKYLTLKLKKILDKGKNVKILSDIGTNLEFSIDSRLSIPDYGDLSEKGSFNNLPSGECFIAPMEGTANGKFVVDASMGTGILKNKVEIFVERGKAILFKGDESKQIKNLFLGKDSSSYMVAEFGIGTNDKARITGNVLEDEKVLGTCHIALGNNIHFGGKNDAPIHIDGIMKNPTIEIDGKLIMKRGKLLI